ncbi:MAG: hypothetical protein Q3999_04835 [Buchananella hordeovulneris]|nr:hypothetical protein [Buchananella hordeovulneris]
MKEPNIGAVSLRRRYRIAGALVLLVQIALALGMYFWAAPYALSFSYPAFIISWLLPIYYAIDKKRGGDFHKHYPVWAVDGFVSFQGLAYAIAPQGPPHSWVFWVLLLIAWGVGPRFRFEALKEFLSKKPAPSR